MTWTGKPSLPALHKLTATEVKAITDEIERIGNDYVGRSKPVAGTGAVSAETFLTSVTFTADGVTRYRAKFIGVWQGATAGTNVQLRLRYAAGATVTTAGTVLMPILVAVTTLGKANTAVLDDTWVPAAGQTTVGVSVACAGGTASLDYGAGITEPVLEVTRVT